MVQDDRAVSSDIVTRERVVSGDIVTGGRVTGDMDWSSLVDTATKAMFSPEEGVQGKQITEKQDTSKTVG